MKITVLVREVHIQAVSIEAKDEDEAIVKIANGEGDEVGEPYYYQTLDPSTWSVGR